MTYNVQMSNRATGLPPAGAGDGVVCVALAVVRVEVHWTLLTFGLHELSVCPCWYSFARLHRPSIKQVFGCRVKDASKYNENSNKRKLPYLSSERI